MEWNSTGRSATGPMSEAPATVRCAVDSPALAGASASGLPAEIPAGASEAGAPGVVPRERSSAVPLPTPPRVSLTAEPDVFGPVTVAGLVPKREVGDPDAVPAVRGRDSFWSAARRDAILSTRA